MTRPTATQMMATALLAGASFASQAADIGGVRIATGVGYWIAAQGNAALREIRHDLQKDLADRLQPLLPAPAESRADESAPAASGAIGVNE